MTINSYQITGPAPIGVSSGRTSGHMLRKILEAHGGKLPADASVVTERPEVSRPRPELLPGRMPLRTQPQRQPNSTSRGPQQFF